MPFDRVKYRYRVTLRQPHTGIEQVEIVETYWSPDRFGLTDIGLAAAQQLGGAGARSGVRAVWEPVRVEPLDG